MPIRVLVADDHALVRGALEGCLGAAPDLRVVATACDGREAVELAGSTRPDVVVMDLRMPVLDGVAAARAIVSLAPRIRVLMFSGVSRRADVRAAFAAGASGYLLKNGDPSVVIEGVRTCHAGGRALSRELRRALDG
jgi:DNA-binding NarL/FixJ family response regulator